ncbi:2'-5' RNA ligase family protein [Streptomyces phaeolivaceus]|uniref:2'-5' RNA ligase family protein n=1 Tax=Streptomyces phaeolivaceus TaxID=2653200 RepID=A0A5P8K3D2_9ACTN|nr:2'-5' RNA ligase family protein [Streptomyces phaeolivaceus]QFQ97278.1 2'-5' RNA ligase family protein [Streptomyces phaeolivaceus]
MRRFLSETRLWEPDARGDRVKAHVLWLPHRQPQVLAYFARLRAILARYPDVITPVADADLHMTLQKIDTHDIHGEPVTCTRLHAAADALRAELASLEPFGIEIGPARASGSAAVVEIWPEPSPQDLYDRVRAGLLTAGLSLPQAERPYWCHMTGGYGKPRELHQMRAFVLVA